MKGTILDSSGRDHFVSAKGKTRLAVGGNLLPIEDRAISITRSFPGDLLGMRYPSPA